MRGPRRETDRHPLEHEQQEAGPEERFPLHDPGGNIGERRAVRPEHQENREKRLGPLHLRGDQRFRKRRHEYQHDRARFESIPSPPPSPPFTNYELRFLAEVPEVPYGLKVLDKSGRSVQLSWAAPYDGNSPIKRYVIEYKISKGSWETDIDRVLVPGSQQNVAGVFNLRPATTYHLRIVAENEIGASDPSDTVTIITAEEAPSGPPTSIRVDDLDQHTLKVPPPLRVSLSFFLSFFSSSLRILLDSGNVETAPSRGLERRDPWILRRLQALLLRETVHVRNRGLLEGGRKGAPPADHEPEDVHPVQRGRASVQQSGIGADERGAEAAHRRGRTRATPSRHHLHHLDLPDHQDLLDVAPS